MGLQVEFKDVKMRYRPGLPLVLHGLTVTVPPGSRCGVVGRTGAGKSSLINCLFRLQELSGGAIVIDGIDIAKMGLHQLRNGMAIIPQVRTRISQYDLSNGLHDLLSALQCILLCPKSMLSRL